MGAIMIARLINNIFGDHANCFFFGIVMGGAGHAFHVVQHFINLTN